MHRAVAFHGKQLGHLHRSNFGDSSQIVAQQIHDHDVFGQIFRVRCEPVA